MFVRLHSSSRAAKKTLGRPHWSVLGLLLIACNDRLAVLDPPLETTDAGAAGASGASGVETEPTPVYSERQLAEQAATIVLWTKCGQCHSPAAAAQYSAGINLLVGIDDLVEPGLVVPLSSATSRIVVVMRNGSMPPPGPFDGDAGPPQVTEADIQVVASFIDNPSFWPNSSPPAVVDAGLAPRTSDAGADGG